MKQERIFKLLQALYIDTIKEESALKSYKNFLKICSDEDDTTLEYLLNVVSMTAKERLVLRNSIAERGYELTPNELDQYIFLLTLAIYEHIEGNTDRERF
tara:strand:+ start:91 stop:390 length:300 start_codon:yes stop_codon:yes gene_type:complete